jgi:hypothetical protein
LGGINGGLVLLRPSRTEFFEMMAHLGTYYGTGAGAEQDFLTDFWKNKGGIAGLPRKYNCQLHQVALMGPEAEETSVYWRMVANYEEEVANWHFSADPKPVDMIWGSVAFPLLEARSGSVPWVSTTTNVEAAMSAEDSQRDLQGGVVLTPRWAVKGKGKGKTKTAGRGLNLIERGPMRGEYAAPWRHKFTLTTLQVEMARRAAKWRTEGPGPTQERSQKITEIMAAATMMWIQSLHDTVWPNILFMVSEEIRLRSRSGRDEACLICHQKYEYAGRNMEHNDRAHR